jgi:hypothetical protein
MDMDFMENNGKVHGGRSHEYPLILVLSFSSAAIFHIRPEKEENLSKVFPLPGFNYYLEADRFFQSPSRIAGRGWGLARVY